METNQMMNEDDTIEIDVKSILIDLWRKLPLIILIGAITAGIGFGYSSFGLTPMYESTTKMYVLTRQSDEQTMTISDLQMGTLLTNDYVELIKSRYVVEKVISDLKLNMDYGSLLNEISISIPESTRIIVITVKDSSPVNAMKIADALRETASEQITAVMSIEAVNVVETANLPTEKCEPSITKYTMLGGIAGIFLMCFIFALRVILNDSIQTPEDIEKKLGLSVLTIIPIDSNYKKKKKNKKNK